METSVDQSRQQSFAKAKIEQIHSKELPIIQLVDTSYNCINEASIDKITISPLSCRDILQP